MEKHYYFWSDKKSFTYEPNLFFEKAEFPGVKPKSNLRLLGNHLG